MKFNVLEIDGDDIRKINRTARRNAAKKNGGQDRFKPKVESTKVHYTRKQKHKGIKND